MRREELYLHDIIDAADAIQRFVNESDEGEFSSNEMRRSAVLQKLLIIGEAAARIPKSFAGKYPTIPWSDMVSFRNIVVHEYFSVDWSIVWTTATHDVPQLRAHVAKILASEINKQE
jgi:uncharacterized protein with HEPN domain